MELVELIRELLVKGKVAHTFFIRESGEEYKTVFIPSELLRKLDTAYRKLEKKNEK